MKEKRKKVILYETDKKVTRDSVWDEVLNESLSQCQQITEEERSEMDGEVQFETSYMLHFSSWVTFLCSSWLWALQVAILEEIPQWEHANVATNNEYNFLTETPSSIWL